MYFAIEPTATTLPQQTLQALTGLQSQHMGLEIHLFALVDGAFDDQFLAPRRRKPLPNLSLYADTPLQGFALAAPHLLVAPPAPNARLAWLQSIHEACTGKPMLSVLASTLDGPALQQHLRPYLQARTPDTLEWPLRWADTRVLPALLEALEPDQHAHLLAPLLGWWAPRHTTELAWSGHSGCGPGGI